MTERRLIDTILNLPAINATALLQGHDASHARALQPAHPATYSEVEND